MGIDNERKPNGTFAAGNKGGPGRPRRRVELEYMGIVADVVPLERWRKIVEEAAKSAESGDATARNWLGRYVLGATPPTMWDLAKRDRLGVSIDDELEAQLDYDLTMGGDQYRDFEAMTPYEVAAKAKRKAFDEAYNKMMAEAKEKQLAEAREVARQKREAKKADRLPGRLNGETVDAGDVARMNLAVPDDEQPSERTQDELRRYRERAVLKAATDLNF